MADIILKTPQGPGPSSWNAVADDDKFQFRSGSKNTVLELNRAGGGEYTDDFATNPFSAPARLTNMLADLWYHTSGYIRTPVGTTTNRCYFNQLGDFTNIIMKAKFWRDYMYSNHGLYGRINNATGTGYGIHIGDSQLTIYLYKSTGAGNANKTLLDSESFDVSYGWVWLKLSLQGTTIKGKVWRDGDSEPTTGGPDNDGYQLKATDSDYSTGKLGFYSYEHHFLHYTRVDDFWCDAGLFPTTSPVRYAPWDSGEEDTAWASGKIKVPTNVFPADAGTVKVKEAYSNILYGVGDEAAVDAIASGSWLTPDGAYEVDLAGGAGRYRYLLFQFNSDGSQQTSLAFWDEGQEISIETVLPAVDILGNVSNVVPPRGDILTVTGSVEASEGANVTLNIKVKKKSDNSLVATLFSGGVDLLVGSNDLPTLVGAPITWATSGEDPIQYYVDVQITDGTSEICIDVVDKLFFKVVFVSTPTPPTITSEDNKDGTGVVFTLSGYDVGTTNTLYLAKNGEAFVSKGSAWIADKMAITLDNGLYWAYVKSMVGDLNSYSAMIRVISSNVEIPATDNVRIAVRVMKATAVYWPPETNWDEFGKPIPDEPIEIGCRWEKKAEEFIDPEGTQQISQALVFVDRDLEIGGILMLGTLVDIVDYVNPKANEEAWEIKSFKKLPDLRGTKYLRQVYL